MYKNTDDFNCLPCTPQELSGNVFMNNHAVHVLWEAIDLKALITLIMNNTSEYTLKICVRNERYHTFRLCPHDELCVTIPNVDCIEISCCQTLDHSICVGNYQLCINVMQDCDTQTSCFTPCDGNHKKYSYGRSALK